MSLLKLSHPTKKINARICIPGSKSESNRLLILNALSGNRLTIDNLSTARDTTNLQRILASKDTTVNVIDAGTSMRFLTAYYAATNQHKIITCSERMKERPIAPLVNALSEIGFDVRYMEKEGFPPLEIVPLKNFDKLDNEVFIEGNISSQFITALLLVAPVLPKGLKINFTTGITSRPYIDMTLTILQHFGVNHVWEGDKSLEIRHSAFSVQHYLIGADWSSASYWYSIAFLADEAEIFIEGLKDDWSQGDRTVAEWMKRFGVATEFTNDGAWLRKSQVSYPKLIKLNFKDNPDLAQTFAALLAAGNICATFTGLESLKIKETDRVAALQSELKKVHVNLDYADRYEFYQLKGDFVMPTSPIKTYNDHRMAMSFAPLALLAEVEIEDPDVVDKSYPTFWEDMEKAGFKISSTQ